ncbi:hypothetical protein Poly51_59580 [Rubripirellula tenax]|uniref:Uncharacterized protein n=1 Tax=Rubripirellula tenax TaxID=2528015 RepID=A0A5C6EC17_9BACT|nr:hypothetical protein Poly51_59580 [Rubripirellula tenax]
MLTSTCALACTFFMLTWCVGIFSISFLPLAFATFCLRKTQGCRKVLLVSVATVPIYLSSCGPVAGLVALAYPDVKTTPNWIAEPIYLFYRPFLYFVDDDSTLEVEILRYTNDWIALAGARTTV